MSDKIATWSDIYNKIGEGPGGDKCPTYSEVNSEPYIEVNGSYAGNQLIRIDDVIRYTPPTVYGIIFTFNREAGIKVYLNGKEIYSNSGVYVGQQFTREFSSKTSGTLTGTWFPFDNSGTFRASVSPSSITLSDPPNNYVSVNVN